MDEVRSTKQKKYLIKFREMFIPTENFFGKEKIKKLKKVIDRKC